MVQVSEHVVKEGKSTEVGKDKLGGVHLRKTINSTLDPHEQMDFMAFVRDEWIPENGFLMPTFKIVWFKLNKLIIRSGKSGTLPKRRLSGTTRMGLTGAQRNKHKEVKLESVLVIHPPVILACIPGC
jgi:hypothetical protein